MKNLFLHVLVDEMSVMNQLHQINVKGFRYWTDFYKQLNHLFGSPSEAHFFCANLPVTDSRYEKRLAFLNDLKKQGIHVQEGIMVQVLNKRSVQEKGVDMKLGLQVYRSAILGVKDIVICTADSDIYPAVELAQELGSRVHLVKSDFASCKKLEEVVDSVIPLEHLLIPLSEKGQLKWKVTEKPFIITKNLRNFRKLTTKKLNQGGMQNGIQQQFKSNAGA